MGELRQKIYDFAISYLEVNGESMTMDVIKAFMKAYPDDCKNSTEVMLKRFLSREVSSQLKWYGDKALIKRTAWRTLYVGVLPSYSEQ